MIGVRACLVIVCIFTLAERIPAAQSNPAADQEKPNSEREQIGESLGKPVYRDQLEAQPGSSPKQELHRLLLRVLDHAGSWGIPIQQAPNDRCVPEPKVGRTETYIENRQIGQ
ncbi:MAG: hypothetical protein ACE361_15960 [Aureliella sp.]